MFITRDTANVLIIFCFYNFFMENYMFGGIMLKNVSLS